MHNTTTNEQLEQLTPLAHAIVTGYLKDWPEALAKSVHDEIVQAVLLRVWRETLPRYDPSSGATLATFAYRMMQWAAVDAIREIKAERQFERTRRRLLTDEDEDTIKAPVTGDDMEVRELFVKFCKSPDLTPKQKSLLWLMLGWGLCREDIAAALGVSIETVYSQISRIKSQASRLVA